MQNAITLRSYRVMTSQIQRLKSKSACFERNQTNFLRKIWWESTAWTTAASINRARVIGQSHRSQHLYDQRLRSKPLSPAPQRAHPSVRATAASINRARVNSQRHHKSSSTTSASDQSHFRQHHKGHTHRSARPHPAPQESESTTGSITKGKPSLLVRTQALPASSDKNSGAANHERQSALKYFSSTEAHQKSTKLEKR